MWPSLMRTLRRILKPIVPRRLIEMRRARLRRQAAPINAGITARLDAMWDSWRGELLPGADVVLSARAREVLTETPGRFEDVRFSPSGNRLALVALEASRVVILTVVIRDGGSPRVAFDHEVTLSSRQIRHPHGVAFLDEDTIVVANRAAGTAVFRIPEGSGEVPVTAWRRLRGGGLRFHHSPGSVEVEADGDAIRVMVCDNENDAVASHRLAASGAVDGGGDLIASGLHKPDGIALSPDRRWIAVSNHGSGVINLYRNLPGLDRTTAPAGVLRGLACPHGVRFLRSGTELVAVDAAGPWVHVYGAPGGDWSGERTPVHSVQTIDAATWKRGHVSPGEGGAKGIALDPGERLMVTTCAEQPLGVFELSSVLSGVSPGQ